MIGTLIYWAIGIVVIIILFGVAVEHLPPGVKDFLYRKLFKKKPKNKEDKK